MATTRATELGQLAKLVTVDSNGNSVISGTFDATLPASGVVAGVHGSASSVPIMSVTAQGLIDSVGSAPIVTANSLAFDSATGQLTLGFSDASNVSQTLTLDPFTTADLTEGSNLYYTDARFDSAFSVKTTADLTEGSNLYYTDVRFDSAFGDKSTTNLTEGDNLYYTQGRFDSALGDKTTDNLTEGSNLYYTTARADSDAKAAISVTDAGGDGSLTYSAGAITYTGPSASEVRAHFSGGTGVDIASGVVSIGQNVDSSSSVIFQSLETTGNVTVGGNLQVNGATTTVSSQNLSIEDNMLYLNQLESDGSPTIEVDVGFAANVNDTGTYAHTGFFRDATDATWKLFDGYTPEPDSDLDIDVNHASFEYADLQVADLTAGNITVSGTVDGRDVASDGTKLDGIESGATADQTKSDIDALNINADQVDGLEASQFLRSDASDDMTGTLTVSGNVGVGTTSPSEKLHIKSGGNAYKMLLLEAESAAGDAGILLQGDGGNQFNIQQPGSSAGLFFYDRTNAAYRMYIDATGNVGIGTASPSSKLHVEDGDLILGDWGTYPGNGGNSDKTNGTTGKLKFALSYNSSSYDPAIELFRRNNWFSSIGIMPNQFTLASGHSFDFRTLATDSNPHGGRVLNITELGRLAVTSTDSIPLDITVNSQTTSRIKVYNSNASGTFNYYELQTNGRGSGYLLKNIANNGNGLSNGSLYLWNSGGPAGEDIIEFIPNGDIANRTTIEENGDMIVRGNVGIGSTSPSNQLEVTGGTNKAVISVTNADLGGLHYTDRNGRYLTSNGSGWTSGVDGADPGIVIGSDNSSGQIKGVGIVLHNDNNSDNQYSPTISFGNKSNSGSYNTTYAHIIGRKTGQAADANWSAGELGFYTQPVGGYVTNTPRLLINSAGNVGIGTTSPDALLHVGANGSSVRNAIAIGTNYPSDSTKTGIIKWQDASNITGQISTQYNGSTVDMHFGSLYNSGYNSTSRLVIKGNGNVGIGTTSPSRLLHLSSNSAQLRFGRPDAAGQNFEFYQWASGLNIYATAAASTIYLGRDGQSTVLAAHNGDIRSPIFYDYNDTNYYVNPNGTSSMYNVNIRGDVNSTGTDNQIFFWSNGNTTTSAIGFKSNGGNFTNPTGNGDGYNTYLTMDTSGRGWVFRQGTGGTNFTAAYTSGWILNNGIWQSNASMRSQIFYDSNNTAYYFHGDNTGDSIRVAGDIVAYYSDERLKDKEGNISGAIDKVSKLNGFYYRANKKAQELGYDTRLQVGVSAQEVEAVLPEVVKDAPIGQGYKTVKYDRMVPLLIEAIKEQQEIINKQSQDIDELKQLVKQLMENK